MHYVFLFKTFLCYLSTLRVPKVADIQHENIQIQKPGRRLTTVIGIMTNRTKKSSIFISMEVSFAWPCALTL